MNVRIFGFEPAVIAYAINAAVAMAVAWGLNLTQEQVGAITTIVTGVLAIVVAFMTRPVVVSTVTGSAATVLAAVAAFGFELSAEQIGTAVTFGSVVLALLLRQNVSPAPAVKEPTRV